MIWDWLVASWRWIRSFQVFTYAHTHAYHIFSIVIWIGNASFTSICNITRVCIIVHVRMRLRPLPPNTAAAVATAVKVCALGVEVAFIFSVCGSLSVSGWHCMVCLCSSTISVSATSYRRSWIFVTAVASLPAWMFISLWLILGNTLRFHFRFYHSTRLDVVTWWRKRPFYTIYLFFLNIGFNIRHARTHVRRRGM